MTLHFLKVLLVLRLGHYSHLNRLPKMHQLEPDRTTTERRKVSAFSVCGDYFYYLFCYIFQTTTNIEIS